MILIAATGNKGKLKEIKQILSQFDVLSLQDIQFHDEIVEDGATFYENALIKARAIYSEYHKSYANAYVLSDDSGLEVDALEGRPGIYSARYAGENASQAQLIHKLLGELKHTEDQNRTARFVCAMVLITPEGEVFEAEGYCEGKIGLGTKGENGFGYDPIFYPKDFQYQKTMSELSDLEKNSISHRRRALDGIKKILEELPE